MEEECTRAIVAGKAFDLIAYRMAMYQIHDDLQPKPMGSIDQCLQVIRCTEATTRCIEARDMVAKGSIVRMFLHGHDLDSVVAKVDDTWEYLLLELSVCTYLTLL